MTDPSESRRSPSGGRVKVTDVTLGSGDAEVEAYGD